MAEAELLGVGRLLRRLNALEGKVQRKVVKKAAREAGRPMLAAARKNAPRRSGKLSKSIKLRTYRRKRTNIVGARITTGSKTGDFDGDTYYGAFVEYGHKIGKRSRAVARHQRRQSRFRRLRPLRADATAWQHKRRAVVLRRAKRAAPTDNRGDVAPREFMKRAAAETKGQAARIFRDQLSKLIVTETLAVS